jgi:hypothetical protein
MTSIFERAGRHIWSGDEVNFKELLQAGLALQTAAEPLEAAELLHAAVNRFEQYPNFLPLLLAAGYPLDLPKIRGETALMAASGCGMAAAMQLLLAAGADPFWTNEHGANAASMSLACEDEACSTCEQRRAAHRIVTALGVTFDPLSKDAAERIFDAGRHHGTWHLIPIMERLGVPGEPLGWTAYMKKIAAGTATTEEAAGLSLVRAYALTKLGLFSSRGVMIFVS